MGYLGIHPTSGVVYLGDNTLQGYRHDGLLLLTPIRFDRLIETPDPNAPGAPLPGSMVFREWSFDPITRVRRGDVFVLEGGPRQWFVHDPLRRDGGNAMMGLGGRFEERLHTYQHAPLHDLRGKTKGVERPRVILGSDDFVTSWRILHVEAAVGRNVILTLKDDEYLGELPQVVEAAVPDELLPRLKSALEDVAHEIHGANPTATVDSCRNALSAVFGYLAGDAGLELATAIGKWAQTQSEPSPLAARCGYVVARLHARGKVNVQASRGTPPLRESDARLAVCCLWTVLVDQSWANG